METVLKAISDWIKSLLTAAIMSNLSGLFDDVNTQVGSIAQQVGTKPSSFEPRVFAMIEALSRNVVLPIAGVILTFIACYELIQMITEHNNMAQFEPALILKWIFKTAISVWMISNTFDIIMAVFDVTQQEMSEKLDKLRASLEKERERRIKINNRIESLERRIQEAEAAEVNEMVRTAKVTPEQLAALLRQSATSTPTPAALSAVGATFNKEKSNNEDDE